jgi:glycosyltransferase involved in cell wall biosynthesis
LAVDYYMTGKSAAIPASLREDEAMRVYHQPMHWDWQRWYSRNPLSAFITGQAARGAAQLSLARMMAERHAREPYDLVYQFSQIELFGLRGQRGVLPPIVVHPGVHAAGELTWHRREDSLAARGERRQRRMAARAMLVGRAARQRRDIRLVRRVIAPSRVFAAHLSEDYDLPIDRISVVPHPIDLARFAPRETAATNGSERPLRLLFVSRLSVRKGLDLVVALSHRLADMAGKVQIDVIGDKSLWSDYRALLPDLNPAIASYRGQLDDSSLSRVYADADGLIQPSKYEPFGLVVAEALASGIPVVASDEVGATEGVDPGCCSVFRSGDLGALERAVREMIARIESGARPEIAHLARAEAERHFSVERAIDGIVQSLDAALAGRLAR